MKYKSILLALCSSILLWTSCSRELDSSSDTWGESSTPRLSLDLSATSPKLIENAQKLEYKIFLYRTDLPSDGKDHSKMKYYTQYDWMTFAEFRKFQFSIPNQDFRNFLYRIVVIAGLNDGKYELHYDAPQDDSSSLADFKISRRYDAANKLIPLSKDNYISSSVISNLMVRQGRIKLNFTRLVGQLLFDVGKYDSKSTAQPLDADFNSTLDRVHTISVDFKNYTEGFYPYKDKKQIITCASSQKESIVYNFSHYLEPVSWKMINAKLQVMPDGKTGVLCDNNSADINPHISVGGTRIYGPYQLVNINPDFSAVLDFQYYDTYFENPLTTKHVVLTLPQPQPEKRLKVYPNSYTTTKIKIVQNRIIDIKQDFGNIDFDHTWK